MPFSLYSRNKFLDHVHGKAAWTMPSPVYVGFSTTGINISDGGATEPVGNGYARVAVPAASWGTAASGAITNTAAITFPTATGSGWGTVTTIVVYDAPTGGNLLWYANVASQAVPAGVTPSLAVGEADSSFT